MKVANINEIYGGEKVLIARTTMLFMHDLDALKSLLSALETEDRPAALVALLDKIIVNVRIYEINDLMKPIMQILEKKDHKEIQALIKKEKESFIQLIENTQKELNGLLNNLR